MKSNSNFNKSKKNQIKKMFDSISSSVWTHYLEAEKLSFESKNA